MSQQGRIEDAVGDIGVETLTGNTGGPVAPDGAGNIDVLGSAPYTVSGNPGTFTLTITDDGTIASSFPTDGGTAVPAAGALTIAGGTGITTSGAASTVTIDLDSPVTVTNGGTGATTLTGVLTGNGTSAITANAVTQYTVLLGGASNAVNEVSGVGTSGQVLTSNGAGMDPTWQDASGGVNGPGSSTDNALARWNGTGGDTLQDSTVLVSDNGEMTNASQPAFRAYPSATLTNVTGDGTGYTVIFNTEAFDQNSDFNTGTGVFTAPVSGKYQLSTTIGLSDLTTSHTDALIQLSTSNWANDQVVRCNMGAILTNPTSFTASALKDMDAADTASVVVTVSGSTLTVDVTGSTMAGSSFSGALIC